MWDLRAHCFRVHQSWLYSTMHNGFPPPWTVEEQAACFVVRDHNGQQLAYVYFEDEPGRRLAAKLLSRDEARRIAVDVPKLPEFIRRPLQMRTPDEYREFAAECYRLAAEAKNEGQEKILREMACAWSELAEEVERKS